MSRSKKALLVSTVLGGLAVGAAGYPNFQFQVPGGIVRYSLDYFTDQLNVKNYGAIGDGVTDDTAAFTSVLTRALMASKGATIHVPPGYYSLNACLTGTLGNNQSLDFGGDSSGMAKLNFASGLACAAALSINVNNTAPGTSVGSQIAVHNMQINAGWTGIKATALLINSQAGAQAVPSVKLDDLTFNDTQDALGWWNIAIDIEGLNIVRGHAIHCFEMAGGTCLNQNITSGGLSVDHDYDDLYAQAAGVTYGGTTTAVNLGSPTTTIPLQGITIRRLSCTGVRDCLVANTAGGSTRPGDQITVSDGQINAYRYGFNITNWDSINIHDNYMLGNSLAVNITGSKRIKVSDNIIFCGSAAGYGTPTGILLTNDGGTQALGNLVSNNVFAGCSAGPNGGVVNLAGSTDYTYLIGNNVTGVGLLADMSSGTSNYFGPNMENNKQGIRNTTISTPNGITLGSIPVTTSIGNPGVMPTPVTGALNLQATGSLGTPGGNCAIFQSRPMVWWPCVLQDPSTGLAQTYNGILMGSVAVQTGVGAPSGVPTAGGSGNLFVDALNGHLYIYRGTIWNLVN